MVGNANKNPNRNGGGEMIEIGKYAGFFFLGASLIMLAVDFIEERTTFEAPMIFFISIIMLVVSFI